MDFELGNFLIFASSHSLINCVKELIEYGADVNYEDEVENVSPLICACRSGSVECAKFLIDAGAEIEFTDSCENSALSFSCMESYWKGFYECAKLLINSGADINIQNHGLSQQVFPIQSDLFSGIENEKYDLIVSNPPYVDAEDMENLPEEYKHEPELGLACGHDGLDLVREMLRQAGGMLNEGGILFVEVGNSQVHLQSGYPDIPFQWIEFSIGGHGVFALTKAQLDNINI